MTRHQWSRFDRRVAAECVVCSLQRVVVEVPGRKGRTSVAIRYVMPGSKEQLVEMPSCRDVARTRS